MTDQNNNNNKSNIDVGLVEEIAKLRQDFASRDSKLEMIAKAVIAQSVEIERLSVHLGKEIPASSHEQLNELKDVMAIPFAEGNHDIGGDGGQQQQETTNKIKSKSLTQSKNSTLRERRSTLKDMSYLKTPQEGLSNVNSSTNLCMKSESMISETNNPIYNSNDLNKSNKESHQMSQKHLEDLKSRMKNIENQVQLLSSDMTYRVKKADFDVNSENVQVQLKQMSSFMKLLADKESLKIMKSKLSSLERGYASFVQKTDVEQLVKDSLVSATEKLEQQTEFLYLKKQTFIVENDRSKSQIEKILLTLDGFKEQGEKKEEQWKDRLLEITRKLDHKVEIKIFSEFKEWCGFFIHKEQLEEMYSRVLPSVAAMQQQTKLCLDSVDSFKQFLKRTDEAILFRATRMDHQLLTQDVANKYATVMELQGKLTALTNEVSDIGNQFANKLDVSLRNVENHVKEMLHNDVINDLKIEVAKHFQKLDVNMIISSIEDLKDIVSKKADVSDLILLNESKTHKQNTEKVVEFVVGLHKQLKQVSYSCVQFMKTFLPSAELESINSKQQDVAKAVGLLESLFQTMSNLSIRHLFSSSESSAISPIHKNNQNLLASISVNTNGSNNNQLNNNNLLLTKTTFAFPINRSQINRSGSPFERTASKFNNTMNSNNSNVNHEQGIGQNRNQTTQQNQGRYWSASKTRKNPSGFFKSPIIFNDLQSDSSFHHSQPSNKTIAGTNLMIPSQSKKQSTQSELYNAKQICYTAM